MNIDHQLLWDFNSVKYIQTTKTNAGTRKLPINEDVAECFRRIIDGRSAGTSAARLEMNGSAFFLWTYKANA